MAYIPRSIESEFLALCEEHAIVLVTGMRQCGKSTMLEHLMTDRRSKVTLDDLQERELAKTDPELFLQLHRPPVMIDEVQYAPELFSYLKIYADTHPDACGDIWLTGSQPFALMKLAGETLAGRVGVLRMLPLSQHEMHGRGNDEPLLLKAGTLLERATLRDPAQLPEMYERIFNGSMPAVASGRSKSATRFYRSYVQTYIERDVREMDNAADLMLFSRFMSACAAQAGQLLNIESLARDVGIPRAKAAEWLGILQRSDVVFLLQPFLNNALARAVKTPKLYFTDTGLAAWLGRWSSPETLEAGALSGAIFENYVVSELAKTINNTGDPAVLWFYRDRDAKEIDLILERDGALHPIEIKRTANPQKSSVRAFSLLDRSTLKRGTGAVVCMKQHVSALSEDTLILPVWAL